MVKISKVLNISQPHALNGELMMSLLIVSIVCIISHPAKAETSVYVFDSDQSTVVKTGGFAGVHETYSVTGQFRLSVDLDAGVASFEIVDANMADETGTEYGRNINEIFNMTALVDTVVDDTTIEFEGKTADGTESDVRLKLSFKDDSAHLTGNTTPPPNSADMFFYDVNAVATRKYAGGTGEPNDPYQIATAEDLMLLGETPEDYNKHFILTADIDLDPNLPDRKVFDRAVIAQDTNDATFDFEGTPFTGVFDGNGHVLSNLSVQGGGHLGLFGILDKDAIVTDLGIENVSIQGMGDFIGGLVGDNYGSVSNCYITGTVSGNDAISVGGLVGDNSGDVTRCYSSGAVNGGKQVGGLIGLGSATHCYSTATVSGNRYVGGLVGTAGNVKHCYSAGEVSGDKYVGGLVGYNFWSQLTQCYSTGAVNGNDSVGGLVGYSRNGNIIHCYSTGVVSGSSNVGGLMGWNEKGTVLDCLWDIETSNQNTSAGGIGKTTAAMQDIRTYLDGGWDFVDEIGNGTHQIWQMPEEGGYPILSIFNGYNPLQLNGLGTAEDPYLISNAPELGAMIYYSPHAHYRLDSSIDLSGICWGTAVIPAFEGTFDGNNLTISHLTIKGVSNLGLFERLTSGAEIKYLELVNVNITGLGRDVGGLAVYNYGTMTHCYSTGTGAVSGEGTVGGLVGYNVGTMIHCYSTGSVLGLEGWAAVGGLTVINDGTVTQCYSTGAVSGGSSAGGLMSHNYGTVTQCYSTGAVSGREWVGGLVGFNYGTVIQCYSTGTVFGHSDVGGLIGYNPYNGRVTNCFWDTQTSGQTKSSRGTGKTTVEMQMASTFLETGWDFVDETTNGTEDIWWILEGQDYPRLWWELSD